MTCCRTITLVSLFLIALAASPGFGQEKSLGEDQVFVFETEVHVDLLFHVLAHLDLGKDASNLYSEDYIRGIAMEKRKRDLVETDLQTRVDSIKDVFISDNDLRMINFLPFYVTDYEEFIDALDWLAAETKEKNRNETVGFFKTRFITTQKQRDFIGELSNILNHEYQTFYRDFWISEQGRLAVIREQFEGFVKTNGKKLFSPIMKKEKKDAGVYLSLSMTRAGRGFGSGDRFGAAVKFPEKTEEFLPGLIVAVHEMTHQFSDALVMKTENLNYSQRSTSRDSEGYRIHLAVEHGAIYADYLLFQRFLPEYLREYILFFSDDYGKKIRDKPTKELVEFLKTRLKLSDESIEQITRYVNELRQ